MIFEYLQRVVIDAEIDIDNIGQCVLQANNDIGEEFYLVIRTELGWTEVIEYGPCTPDLDMLPMSYQINYLRFEYSEGKIERIIDKFLNNPKRGISQAKMTDLDSIRPFMVNPVDKMFDIGGSTFE